MCIVVLFCRHGKDDTVLTCLHKPDVCSALSTQAPPWHEGDGLRWGQAKQWFPGACLSLFCSQLMRVVRRTPVSLRVRERGGTGVGPGALDDRW